MNNDEIILLLHKYGQEISMMEWEITSYIKLCTQKNILRKGYRVLFEYLQLQSDIQKLLTKRSSYSSKIYKIISSNHTEGIFELPFLMNKLCEYSLKLWISICRWRQLQWSPRTIFIFNTTTNQNENFILELERDMSQLLQLIYSTQFSLLDADIPVIHLITLMLTTIPNTIHDENILNLLFYSKNSPSIQGYDKDQNQHNQHLKNINEINQSLSRYEELFQLMSEISHEETAIAHTWITLSHLNNTNYQQYPVLRIIYDEVIPPSQENLFHTPEKYSQTCQILLTYFTSHYSSPLKTTVAGVAAAATASSSSTQNLNYQHFETLKTLNELNSLFTSSKKFPSPYYSSKISATALSNSSQPSRQRDLSNSTRVGLMPPPFNSWVGNGDKKDEQEKDHHSNSQEFIEPTSIEYTAKISPHLYHSSMNQSSSSPPPAASTAAGSTAASTVPAANASPSKNNHEQQHITNEKFKIIETTILAYGGKELFLQLERKRVDVSLTQLLVRGYQHGCSQFTQQECQIGDEILEINGVAVSGKKMKELMKAIQLSHKEKLFQTQENGELKPFATKVNLKLKRYYPRLTNSRLNESTLTTTTTTTSGEVAAAAPTAAVEAETEAATEGAVTETIGQLPNTSQENMNEDDTMELNRPHADSTFQEEEKEHELKQAETEFEVDVEIVDVEEQAEAEKNNLRFRCDSDSLQEAGVGDLDPNSSFDYSTEMIPIKPESHVPPSEDNKPVQNSDSVQNEQVNLSQAEFEGDSPVVKDNETEKDSENDTKYDQQEDKIHEHHQFGLETIEEGVGSLASVGEFPSPRQHDLNNVLKSKLITNGAGDNNDDDVDLKSSPVGDSSPTPGDNKSMRERHLSSRSSLPIELDFIIEDLTTKPSHSTVEDNEETAADNEEKKETEDEDNSMTDPPPFDFTVAEPIPVALTSPIIEDPIEPSFAHHPNLQHQNQEEEGKENQQENLNKEEKENMKEEQEKKENEQNKQENMNEKKKENATEKEEQDKEKDKEEAETKVEKDEKEIEQEQKQKQKQDEEEDKISSINVSTPNSEEIEAAQHRLTIENLIQTTTPFHSSERKSEISLSTNSDSNDKAYGSPPPPLDESADAAARKRSTVTTAATFIIETSSRISNRTNSIFSQSVVNGEQIDDSPSASKRYRKRFLSANAVGGSRPKDGELDQHLILHRGRELFEAEDDGSCASSAVSDDIIPIPLRPSQMVGTGRDVSTRSRFPSEDSVTEDVGFNDRMYLRRVSGRSRGDSIRVVSALTDQNENHLENNVTHIRRDWFRRMSRAYPSSLNEIFDDVLEKYREYDLVDRASALIAAWWKITYPHKLLTNRLKIRKFCLEIVNDTLERVTAALFRSDKLKYKLMRHGAASQIQKTFRIWKITVLMNVTKIQQIFRRYRARRSILYLVKVTRAALRIARFLFHRKIRKKLPLGKKKLYRSVVKGFHEAIGFRLRENKYNREIQKLPAQLLREATKRGIFITRRNHDNLMVRRYAASTKIQSIVRRMLAKAVYVELLREHEIQKKVTAAMILIRFRKKICLKKRRLKHCITLQRWWRGISTRFGLLIRVLAGVRINNAWRSYRQYWKLKRRLRRNDYPILLTLHEIVNLPPSCIETGSIRVVVSVWWSKLLHLVEQDDFSTIMQSKLPNIVRTSSYFQCTEAAIKPPAVAPLVLPTDSLQLQLQEFHRKISKQGQMNSNSDWRKPSLSQRVASLNSARSPTKVMNAADALAHFAKIHGVQGAHVKTGSHLSPSSSNSSKGTPKEVPEQSNVTFKAMAKKVSLQRATIIQLSQNIKDSLPIKKSHSKESSSSSSSSSHSSNHSQEDEEKPRSRSHSHSSSDDDEDDEEGDTFPNDVKVPVTNLSPSPTKVKQRASLAFDTIGRDCVNTLGTNLLAQSDSALEDSSQHSGGSKLVEALHAIQSSVNFATDLNLHTTKKQSTLKPLPKKENVKVTRGASDNPLLLTMGFGNLVGMGSPKPKISENLLYNVNLNEEFLYIPGCHGNSVIKFDIYDGIRKIGHSTYHLSEDGHLMFWGDSNMSRHISLIGTPTEAFKSRLKQRKYASSSSQATLKVGVTSLPPGVSRCGVCAINFRGTGPIRRKMRTRGFIKSFLDIWENFYISLDGVALHLYESRTDPESFLTVELIQIKALHLELFHHNSEGKKKHTSLDDRYMVVLSTHGWDVIRLHFQESRIREAWVRSLMQAAHRSSSTP